MKRDKIQAGLSVFLIIAVITIGIMHPTAAIGVGPAETKIDYQPNLTTNYSITVFNTEKKEAIISLKLEGELEQYIKIESQNLFFSKDENQKTAVFSVSFPRDVPPGIYTGKLLILQDVPGQEGTIKALTGLTHDIILNVPAHGKYIKEYFEFDEKSVNVRIVNIGLKEINSLEITSLVYDDQNAFKQEFNREGFVPDEEFAFSIDLDKPPGWHEHQLIIRYDELNKSIKEVRTIGEIIIDIKKLEFGEFKKGEIAPITFELESNWNSELEKVRVEADIIKDGQIIKTLNGADETINNHKNTTIYLETQDLQPGSYELRARTIYQNEPRTEKTFMFTVSEGGLALKKELKTSQYIIISLLIALIVILTLLLKKAPPSIKKKDLYSKLSKKK